MDAIALLKKDHAKVTALFRRFDDGGGLTGVVKRLTGNTVSPRQRQTIVDQICRELEVHAAIEEAVFYPAVRALQDEPLAEMLDEAEREHRTIKERVQEVRTAEGDADGLRAATGNLRQCVDHHVREEESEMFPLVEERMPEAERTALGRVLAAQKKRSAPPAASRKKAAKGKKTTGRKAAGRTAAAAPATTRRRAVKTAAKARKRAVKRRAGRR